MRSITVDEAEQRFRALLDEVRGGARLSVHDNHVPVAAILPPPPRDDLRELAFLRLKRHLSRCGDKAGPRLWTRAALYRDRPRG